MVSYITIKGTIKNGKLDVQLPEDVIDGEVEVLVPVSAAVPEDALTDEEWREMMNFQGKTLGEILTTDLVGAGADWDIGDSAEWVSEQRLKQTEETKKKWIDS